MSGRAAGWVHQLHLQADVRHAVQTDAGDDAHAGGMPHLAQ